MSPLQDSPTVRPGTLIGLLLRNGLGGPAAIKRGRVTVPEDVDWAALCAVSHRCRIAPVIYQCLRGSSLPVPPGVAAWFRAQYYEAVARHLASLNELRELLGWFSEAGIPAVVLKGPALAQLGLGAARIAHDLDVLIHHEDLRRADAILVRHQYDAMPDPPHDFHRRYGRPAPWGMRVLEVHFDITDRPRPYRPDIADIWERSVVTTVFEVPARVPELGDHFLLTLMQLPHHHWAVRLIVDAWQVARRWSTAIDWMGLLSRAAGWEMGVLTRSALHTMGTMFDVPIPAAVMAASSPSGYLERVQWRIAREAVAEQLEYPFRPRLTWAAPFVMLDHPGGLPAVLIKRTLGAGGSPLESAARKTTRRTAATMAALPALGKVFLASLSPGPRRQDGRGGR